MSTNLPWSVDDVGERNVASSICGLMIPDPSGGFSCWHGSCPSLFARGSCQRKVGTLACLLRMKGLNEGQLTPWFDSVCQGLHDLLIRTYWLIFFFFNNNQPNQMGSNPKFCHFIAV